MRAMIQNADKIPPYERQHLLVFKQDVESSPYLNETQKLIIERKLQEIVDTWIAPTYM